MEINEKEKSELDNRGKLNESGETPQKSSNADDNDAIPEKSIISQEDEDALFSQENNQIQEEYPNDAQPSANDNEDNASSEQSTILPENSDDTSAADTANEIAEKQDEPKSTTTIEEESVNKEVSPEAQEPDNKTTPKKSEAENMEKQEEPSVQTSAADIPQSQADNSVELPAAMDPTQETQESTTPTVENQPDVASEDSNKKGDEQESDEKEDEQQLDYSNYTKRQMVQVLESFLKEDNFSQVGRILKEIKKPFDELVAREQEDAYNKYIEDGGEKDGFEYRGDELDQRFMAAYNKLRERKNEFFNSLEIKKEQNLKAKLYILEKLRELVDSEETGASIKDLKDLQVQWKEVGPVPSSQLKNLWANYNALIDRFYDNRSIYFELKELDRKKNFDLKIELCVKAEQLADQDDIKDVIKQLNDLHEEFKHIGPVPQSDQEALWERFKSASDAIYAKRKDYYEQLKQELKVNQSAKEALAEKVMAYADFNSDKISEWNSKTKEILAIQKEWEAIGSIPKERAKKVNKQFWAAFKGFFNKKGQFFKVIEEERKNNLKLKQLLVDKAESLKESDDFQNTSEELKKLQQEWKDIGPVPEKYRNDIFNKFKKACDHFFNRRRKNSQVVEKEYELNLKSKEALCVELEQMIKSEKIDMKRVKAIEAEWAAIGFVPRNSVKSIHKRYTDAIELTTENMDISEDEKHKLRFKAQFNNLNFGPGSERVIQKKEGALRRQISALENDINLWKNNIDFFASSKNADKLKHEFNIKIEKASAQLNSLKEQLKILSNI